MHSFAFFQKPNILGKRPAWMADTTVVTTSSDGSNSVTRQPSGGTDLVTVLLVGGAVLAGLELTGVTHVTKWAKKTLGFQKK